LKTALYFCFENILNIFQIKIDILRKIKFKWVFLRIITSIENVINKKGRITRYRLNQKNGLAHEPSFNPFPNTVTSTPVSSALIPVPTTLAVSPFDPTPTAVSPLSPILNPPTFPNSPPPSTNVASTPTPVYFLLSWAAIYRKIYV
jgi:hypothetical protein